MHTIISQLFEELDTCNTGRITEEMLKELLHRLFLSRVNNIYTYRENMSRVNMYRENMSRVNNIYIYTYRENILFPYTPVGSCLT